MRSAIFFSDIIIKIAYRYRPEIDIRKSFVLPTYLIMIDSFNKFWHSSKLFCYESKLIKSAFHDFKYKLKVLKGYIDFIEFTLKGNTVIFHKIDILVAVFCNYKNTHVNDYLCSLTAL